MFPKSNGNAVGEKNDDTKDQRGLSHKSLLSGVLAIIGLIVIILFVVVIILLVLHGRDTNQLTDVVLEMQDKLDAVQRDVNKTAAESRCLTPECVLVAGQVISKMDLNTNPCEDFYEYSCGRFAENPLNPQDKAVWDSIRALTQANLVRVNRLLRTRDSTTSGSDENSAVQKSMEYYKVCMNEDAQENTKADALYELLNSLGSWTLTSGVDSWDESTWTLEKALSKSHQLLTYPIIHCGVEQDSRNASINRLACDQPQLLLPARHYYVGNNTTPYKDALIKTIENLGMLLDGSNLTDFAHDVWNLEEALAKVQDGLETRSNYVDLYHKYTVNEFQELLGDTMNISLFFEHLINQTIPQTEAVVVLAPKYMSNLPNITRSFSKETLNNYILLSVAKNMLNYMSSDFQELLYDLNKLLYGSKREMAMWEKCTSRTVHSLGFAVGALFAEKHFTEIDKRRVDNIVEQVREAFTESIDWLDWMDDETRALAKEKAERMLTKIGYPDFILNKNKLDAYYSRLNVTDNAFLNAVNSKKFISHSEFEEYGEPVDRDKWFMHPSVVNAYYNPGLNEMVYPAGILQAPFYHRNYPRSMVFGAIGMVIGHELTHGFDNSGRRYDADGNVHDWWKNSSAIEFERKSQCFVDQYSKFLVHGEPHNGKFTLGENIADNGGIRLSHRAYLNWLKKGNKDITLPGLQMTNEQLFFLGYSQLWCSQATKEFELYLLKWDNHSNGKYRVLGVYMNMEEFSEAFQCSVDSHMNPKDKCILWQ